MKKFYLLITLSLTFSLSLLAESRYWVGPLNGDWSNAANWSLTANGPGSAGAPTTADGAFFTQTALVHMDVSPVIASLRIETINQMVKFYADAPTTLRILSSFFITPFSQLKDSTSTDVSFNLILAGATGAQGTVRGIWEFEGGVPSTSGNGAFFTAEPGALMTIGANSEFSSFIGTVIFKNNCGVIVSSPETLSFLHYSICTFQNNLSPKIPAAAWAGVARNNTSTTAPDSLPSVINFFGAIGNVQHLQAAAPAYGSMVLNLTQQGDDVTLALPNGTILRGDLTVNSTNSKTLTLLANNAPSTIVSVAYKAAFDGGAILINGADTKVALSTVVPGGASIDYRLNVGTSLTKTGGNFSLQDNDNPGGSATLALPGSLICSGGTFISGSTTSNKRLVVEMNGPQYINRPGGTFNIGQNITMSGGSIDNSAHTVTLRIAQFVFDTSLFRNSLERGIQLTTPLAMGKLELVKGILYSTEQNIASINNPDPNAIVVGSDPGSYIVGPFQRSTASNSFYLLPTGGAPTYGIAPGGNANSRIIYYRDTAGIIPASAAPSVYKAEFFQKGYEDSTNFNPPLQTIAKNKYWDITRISGADAAIRLSLKASVAGAAPDKAIVVAHYENGKWEAVNGSALTPGNLAAGSVTSRIMSGFSPFTFGVINANEIPLPIHFSGFTARKTPAGAVLDWSVESLPASFGILRSANGTNYTEIASVQPQAAQKLYQFVDKNVLPGTNYYRIRYTEKDGSKGLSVVNSVLNSTNGFIINSIAPSLVRQTAKLYINTGRAGKLTLIISDMSGRNLKQIIVDQNGGNSEQVLNLGFLPAGTYQVRGLMNGSETAPFRFIKL